VRALFLIDGEHYPPVVLGAIESLRVSLDLEPVAAAFLGGTEKLREGTDYGVPLVKAEDPVSAVEKALREHEVELVVDLSDEPVVGYLAYDYLHWAVHYKKPWTQWGKALRAHHMAHHFACPDKNFGISHRWIDVLVGSMQVRGQAAREAAAQQESSPSQQ